ncbi:MAG: phosphoglycerate kinase [Nanoarchaeota archaeon]|nr:phosphoglycerate kinase [Nanoarchaeota archaeon]
MASTKNPTKFSRWSVKTLDDYNFKLKRVLLRIDLNSPINKKKVEISARFKAHIQTIKELKKKGAKIVIISHQSMPKRKDFISLKQHAKLLNQYIKVKFVDDIIGKKAVTAIKKLKAGEILLLENVRFLKEEFKPSKKNRLIKILSPLFDIYVNDAFSVSHRKQTSIISFSKVLPSCAGRVMEKEINSLKELNKFKKPAIYILGGEKIEDNLLIIKKKKIDFILACGIFGQLCLISKGKDLGEQNKYIKNTLGYKKNRKLKQLINKKNFIFPKDFGVKENEKRKDYDLEMFPLKYEIFDIGPKTQKEFIKIIKKAKSIFMKGTPGFSEDKRFSAGTKNILKAIENSKAFSVIGGGHTTTAIKRFKIKEDKISHISLSGGALIEFLAGKKLPGVEALCMT